MSMSMYNNVFRTTSREQDWSPAQQQLQAPDNYGILHIIFSSDFHITCKDLPARCHLTLRVHLPIPHL